MDVSRIQMYTLDFCFCAGLDDKTAGLLEDCVLSVMRTPRFFFSLLSESPQRVDQLAGVSNSKGFSVSQVLVMRHIAAGPNECPMKIPMVGWFRCFISY